MSRGPYRGVYCALVDDPDFQRLTPDARLALFVCRLCPQAGPAAIFRYYPEPLSLQSGLPPERLAVALQELETERWIIREGVIIWVRNGLRNDPNMHLSDPKHRKAVMRAISALPRMAIVTTFCDYYQLPRPFDGPPKALPRPIEGASQLGAPSTIPSTRGTKKLIDPVDRVDNSAPRHPTDPPPTGLLSQSPPTSSGDTSLPLADLVAGASARAMTKAALRVAALRAAEGTPTPPPPPSPQEDVQPAW